MIEPWEHEPPTYYCEECGHGGEHYPFCDCPCCGSPTFAPDELLDAELEDRLSGGGSETDP